MGLNGALNAALSGLRVSQQNIDVISNNISNVSTPGYNRKTLPQSTQVIEGKTIGVLSDNVVRKVDLRLLKDVWTQVSQTSSLETSEAFLKRIQQFHGPPDSEQSISAEIAEMKDMFAALSDSPGDSSRQAQTINQARLVASRINDFANLVTQMRNDAEDQMTAAISNLDDLLGQVADLNKEIKAQISVGKSTAALEDQRDQLVKDISKEIEISTFKRGDGALVVQTASGQLLADTRVADLHFEQTNIGPSLYYPETVNGIFIGGDPATKPGAFDIIPQGLGSRLGALVELRDETLPKFQAQIDELAHKMAQRFDAQGLRLFTDGTGSIPADTPPDPTTPAGVPYVGFANDMQVNEAIVNDNTLLQRGTYTADNPVQAGSNEVLRRIVDFTFGEVSYQEASNTDPSTAIDVRVPGAPGATDLQDLLGLRPQNTIVSNRDLNGITNLFTDPASPLDPDTVSTPDQEIDFTFGGTNFTVDIADLIDDPVFNVNPPDVDNLVSLITDRATTAGASASEFDISVNTNGQIVFDAEFDISIATNANTPSGTLDYLGLNAGTFQATDPYLDFQVGNKETRRIFIEAGDTETDLLDKLNLDTPPTTDTNGVPDLLARLGDATDPVQEGRLILRPGNATADPDFGGDIKIIGGPFDTRAAANGTSDGTGIVEAIFGTTSPVRDVNYGSQISATNTNTTGFRNNLLGPGANISTDIATANNLIEFSQKIISDQTGESQLTASRLEDELVFQRTVERTLQDESGVNLDQELSQLLLVQNAFSASARTLTTISELFDELLNSV